LGYLTVETAILGYLTVETAILGLFDSKQRYLPPRLAMSPSPDMYTHYTYPWAPPLPPPRVRVPQEHPFWSVSGTSSGPVSDGNVPEGSLNQV